MPPKEKAPTESKRKRMQLAEVWNMTMQGVERVSDSEEESVPDTQQEQWPPPAKPPPAKKTKAHVTHLGGGVRKTHYV